MKSCNTRFILGLGTLALLWSVAPQDAEAAANVAITRSLVSVSADCAQPEYIFDVTGIPTADDGGGVDHVAVVMYDASLHTFDVDSETFSDGDTAFSVQMDYGVGSEFAAAMTARPLHVRVFDTSVESENFLVGAVEAPLLAELVFDPADDAIACNFVAQGPELQALGTSNDSSLSSGATTPFVVDSIDVVTPDDAQLVVMYSAECSGNTNPSNWVAIGMSVDGVAIPNTGTGLAFCSGRSPGPEWIGARAIGVTEVPPGSHTVNITASLQGFLASGNFSLDDRSLAVMLPEPGLWSSFLCGAVCVAGLRRRRNRVRQASRACWVGGGAVALLLLVSSAVPAQAQTKIDFASNTAPQTVNSTPVLLDLGGLTGFFIPVSNPETWTISVTGECAVFSSLDSETYLSLSFLFNGVIISPTSTNYAFCTSRGVASGGWVGASMTVVHEVPVGFHDLEIEAQVLGFGPGEFARLDDLSVTVVRTRRP